ncbi:MAG: ribonuclease Z [Marinicella sp.]
MEIIFLGTSSGTPTKSRNVSAIVVKKQHQKPWCLVDCGEGTQHQLLQTNLALNHLSAIMITHVHGDHCYGLPGLLASASMAGRTEPITVIAPSAIKTLIETTQKISETFLTFEIDFIDVDTMKSATQITDFAVSVLELSHRVPSFAYEFLETKLEQSLDVNKLQQAGINAGPIWGKLQAGENVQMAAGDLIQASDYLLQPRKPRKIIVSGDNDSPELLNESLIDADVLVHESTYTQAVADKVGPGPQHSSAKKVALIAAQAELKNLVLTHFSARYQYGSNQDCSINEIEDEAKSFYQGNLFLANDFDRMYLDKTGQLSLIAE